MFVVDKIFFIITIYTMNRTEEDPFDDGARHQILINSEADMHDHEDDDGDGDFDRKSGQSAQL